MPLLLSWLDHVRGKKNWYFHRSFSGATSTDIYKYTLTHTHTHRHTHLSEFYFLFKSSLRREESLASPIICQCNVFKLWKPHSVLLVSLLFWKICFPRFQHTRKEQHQFSKSTGNGVSNPSAAKNTAIYRPHVLTTGKWRAGAEEKLQPFPS